MQYWSLAAIIISLIIVIVLALKGVKIILIAPVAAVAVAMLSNVNGLAAFTITYMQSFGACTWRHRRCSHVLHGYDLA